MGALVAVLQTDPNLLRCQVARLKDQVALGDGARPPDAYGYGSYRGGTVRSSSRAASKLAVWR